MTKHRTSVWFVPQWGTWSWECVSQPFSHGGVRYSTWRGAYDAAYEHAKRWWGR